MPKRIITAIAAVITAVLAAMLFRAHFTENQADCVSGGRTVTLYRCGVGEIITIPYEDYLVGCIFAEVSPSYGDEALKAAACVINSRCLYLLKTQQRIHGADFSDIKYPWTSPEEAEELHGHSYPACLGKITQAVHYGMEHALFYEDVLISPPMCEISTGTTEDGGLPYLAPKALPADKDNDNGISTRAFPADYVKRALEEVTRTASLPAAPADWFSGAEYTDGGTLTEIRFGGARLTGEQLRTAFGLRSAAVTVKFTEERFVFTSRGIGDNLGMSLHTAAELAASGSTAEEILSSFYAPAQLKNLKN